MSKRMSAILATMVAGAALSVASFTPAGAFPLESGLFRGPSPQVIPVAEGCAYGYWRGPWGQCRNTAYYGHMPDGTNTYRPDCPQGYWVGPWGQCRDTPYHGRLPGGDYR
jgi:hypothetical protein